MTEAKPGEDFDNEEDDGQQNEYSELLSVSLGLGFSGPFPHSDFGFLGMVFSSVRRVRHFI